MCQLDFITFYIPLTHDIQTTQNILIKKKQKATTASPHMENVDIHQVGKMALFLPTPDP